MAKQTDTPAVAGVPGVEGLTFSDLEVHYGAGRSYLIKKDGKKNVTGYRHGVMTKSGDYEIYEWKRLVRQLIEQSGEQELQAQLFKWEREHSYGRRGDKEIEEYALELHASRIFDDRQWCDFIPFNREFRPEALEGVEFLWIWTPCCETPGQVTREQADAADARGGQILCPHCGRLNTYRICEKQEESERTGGMNQ